MRIAKKAAQQAFTGDVRTCLTAGSHTQVVRPEQIATSKCWPSARNGYRLGAAEPVAQHVLPALSTARQHQGALTAAMEITTEGISMCFRAKSRLAFMTEQANTSIAQHVLPALSTARQHQEALTAAMEVTIEENRINCSHGGH